jgi:hypothetical protein
MAHLKMACVGYYFLTDPRKREKTSVREEMRSESVGGGSFLPSFISGDLFGNLSERADTVLLLVLFDSKQEMKRRGERTEEIRG